MQYFFSRFWWVCGYVFVSKELFTFQEIVNLLNSLIKLACLFFFLSFFFSALGYLSWLVFFLIRLPVYRTSLFERPRCAWFGVRNGVVVIQVDELSERDRTANAVAWHVRALLKFYLWIFFSLLLLFIVFIRFGINFPLLFGLQETTCIEMKKKTTRNGWNLSNLNKDQVLSALALTCSRHNEKIYLLIKTFIIGV